LIELSMRSVNSRMSSKIRQLASLCEIAATASADRAGPQL
jgi:hypothetical protein